MPTHRPSTRRRAATRPATIGPFSPQQLLVRQADAAAGLHRRAAYVRDKIRHHNQRLHGTGVVCGLMVQQDTARAAATGSSTSPRAPALDCCGNEILRPRRPSASTSPRSRPYAALDPGDETAARTAAAASLPRVRHRARTGSLRRVRLRRRPLPAQPHPGVLRRRGGRRPGRDGRRVDWPGAGPRHRHRAGRGTARAGRGGLLYVAVDTTVYQVDPASRATLGSTTLSGSVLALEGAADGVPSSRFTTTRSVVTLSMLTIADLSW